MSLSSRLASLRDLLSFSSNVRNLVDVLNHEIEAPEKLRFRLPSHPSGFVKEVSKRRLTIAEAYLKLISSTGVEHYKERLDALQVLVHQAWHAKTLSMPINTARVQVALMKLCVEYKGDKRRQLELMSDFALASYGQENVIRRLLEELDLIEVPEDERPLAEMNLGWDGHVHDFLTEGRKTPSQLLLDAFISGISRLTVAYYDLADTRLFVEAIEAGHILGIQVEVGIEFSFGPQFGRLHFMYLPPGCTSEAKLRSFLDEHRTALEPFFQGLASNAESRRQTISALLDSFNETHLREINDRFRNLPFLQVQELRWEDLEAIIHGGQASRIHVGQLLAERIKPILHKRVLYLKNQLTHARDRLHHGEASSWELASLKQRYEGVREEYATCNAEALQERYMASREGADYPSAFPDAASVLPALASCGGRIVFIHPLSRGVEQAVDTLLACHRWITDLETFNIADSFSRDPADLRRLNALLRSLNRGAEEEVIRLLDDWGVSSADPELIRQACAWYAAHPLVPRSGSDYVGRDVRAAGMGFIASTSLDRRSLRRLERRHPTLAQPIAKLLLQEGREDAAVAEEARVFLLGSTSSPPRNLVGDETGPEHIGLLRFWRYLNLNLKSLIKIGIGFVPAYLAFLYTGFNPWLYAALWFTITGLRNIQVDLVAAAGLAPRSWRLDNIDRDNLANSLFWTGFSVPLLAAAKHGFDLGWPLLGLGPGFLQVLVKFWVIAFANGLYLTTHNRLRGFEKNVIRGNFFRSVLSWPLATVGSYGLDLLGIPAIVQAKFWSDVVAGLIEGTGKYFRRLKLCQRDYLELLQSVLHGDQRSRQVAMTDILFVWARRYQGRSALKRLLRGQLDRQLRLPNGDRMLADSRTIEAAYAQLLSSFSAEGSMEALTNLILRHFSGREAVILTELLADQYDAFVVWLERHRPGPHRAHKAADSLPAPPPGAPASVTAAPPAGPGPAPARQP